MPNAPQTGRSAGFSLLEVTVALFLLGLMLTLVAQSGVRMVERWQMSSTERDIRNQINSLPLQAYASRQNLIIGADNQELLDLETDWQVSVGEPILFSQTGMCSSGELVIGAPRGRTWTYTISPPDCRLEPIS
ncbi:prepilin-type N-terminal cleavage/methylation domain-containing protein [Hyphomonas sp. FCG-A18]|uniref:prepilin-type N-terminal cleavage/methylation domain-containing protein n=1 Tax=Hyphomonas sp. FCG-A18 TaxID=3080019 RepID=UPI002B31C0F0|nr:prepilin-type N-terminal cleavage/methylation domain-containing protein [Hyphomonas sp. FCG-A18]